MLATPMPVIAGDGATVIVSHLELLRPLPDEAKLPLTVQSIEIRRWPLSERRPAPLEAELPSIVEPETVTWPALKRPPPDGGDRSGVRSHSSSSSRCKIAVDGLVVGDVEPVIERLPLLEMPPPRPRVGAVADDVAADVAVDQFGRAQVEQATALASRPGRR